MDEAATVVDVPSHETSHTKKTKPYRQLWAATFIIMVWTAVVGVVSYSRGVATHTQPYAAVSEDQFVIAKGSTDPERLVYTNVMDPGDTPMTCLPTDTLVKIYDMVQLGAFYSDAGKEMLQPIRDRISEQSVPYSNKM